MASATLRIHGSLNDFLPPRRRSVDVTCPLAGQPGVKDVIESLGVPHPEVDLILANGQPVQLGYRVRDGDRIAVYPVERPAELAGLPGLTPPVARPARFVVDGHLGRLARYLRLLGFDTLYDAYAGDEALARLSAADDRILLTRDRGLLKRRRVVHGYLVRDDDPRRQLGEIVARYGLAGSAVPFSRCVRCNGRIEPVGRADVAEILAGEPRTLASFDAFGRCSACGSIYWQGSHFDRMSRLVQDVIGRT